MLGTNKKIIENIKLCEDEYIIETNDIKILTEKYFRNIAIKLSNNPIVINRIMQILNSNTFGFSPITLQRINKELFNNVNKFCGMYKNYDIQQQIYLLFEKEKDFDISKLTIDEFNVHIIDFYKKVLNIQPFYYGNDITVNLFVLKLLQYYNFEINEELFEKYRV